ncbi:MAG: flagellar protein FlgN [bacterium]
METLLLDLEKILFEEISQHERLISLMEKERRYMIKGDIELLSESNKQKETIILEIKMLEEGRIKIIEKLAEYIHLSPSDLTFNKLILQMPSPFKEKFKGYYYRFQNLVKELGSLNKSNLIIIERSLDFINKSLNIFTKGSFLPSYSQSGKLYQKDNSQSKIICQSI